MKLVALLIVQVISLSSLCAAKDVTCEKIFDSVWNHDNVTRKTCEMKETTSINSQEIFISSPVDSMVKAITFYGNKKISFLPSRVDLKFPNLEICSASKCAIENISKVNFKNLKHLTHLWLQDNEIEYIPSDTFEDLIAIQKIYMMNNKIKAVNGITFKRLSKLTYVDLENNNCINSWFSTPSSISNIKNKIDETCKFCESSKSINEQVCEISTQVKEIYGTTLVQMLRDLGRIESSTRTATSEFAEMMNKMNSKLDENIRQASKIASLEAQLISKTQDNGRQASKIASLEAQLAIRDKELTVKSTENSKLMINVTRLETTMIAGEQAKTLLQNQLLELKQVYGKLELQWNATCTERNKELARLVEMKMSEIDQLLTEQDKKKSDLDNCNNLVTYYKKKSDDLSE